MLGFIRTAMGTNNTPPNQVLVGIALFLTLFVMMPTVTAIKNQAWDPLEHHQISTTTAITRAEQPLRQFMFRQTNTDELSLFVNLAHTQDSQDRRRRPDLCAGACLIMSELKTAFEIGFLVFLRS